VGFYGHQGIKIVFDAFFCRGFSTKQAARFQQGFLPDGIKSPGSQTLPIGRVEENDVERPGFLKQDQAVRDVPLKNPGLLRKMAVFEILADNPDGLGTAVKENGLRRTPAQGFDPHSSGAGKKVENPGATQVSHAAEKAAEHGFSDAITGGTDFLPGESDQFLSPDGAADNSHLFFPET
jgi:hypothetical protein